MREALADLIDVLGFETRAFDSSESFLAAHAPGLFGCLVTDLNLPGESGLQLQHRLHALDPRLPVIIVSAQANAVSRDLAMSAGAVAYLTKPINHQVLLRHLTLALDPASPRV